MLLILLLFTVIARSQTLAKTLSKEHPVKSVNWGSKSSHFVYGYWEMAMPQIRKKFTKKLADSIEKYSISFYFPVTLDSWKDSIKMYHVTSFDNNFGGTFHGVNYILFVPYAENKFLWPFDRTKPNDFFLVFPKEAVELEK